MVDGTVKSEPGFAPAIDAAWVGQGADYIHHDPSGKHMRLSAHAVVRYDSKFLQEPAQILEMPVTDVPQRQERCSRVSLLQRRGGYNT